ncbi:MAG: PKD domain-containing protein [Chitinophagaceae bacterium]|nr:MAG: PKD domain-containing protein [Chitinophagaceae bacterium]
MKRNFLCLFCMLMLTLVFTSCKKDDGGSGLKSVFSYVADGYKVNFTNFSTNAKTYSWDFGDGSGETSTARAPQHIFTSKGDFLVTLTADNGSETSTFTDTVSIIGPNIKIDNDLSDWQYVPYAYQNGDGVAGTIRAVKTFAGAQDVFFLLEGTSDMDIELFDMYIDSDNNPATGFATYLYPAGAGADFLLEGPPGLPSWGSFYAHSGVGTGFSFSPTIGFDAGMSFGPVKPDAGKKYMEFSVKKSAINGPVGAISFCFIHLSTGYATLGIIPESEKPDSKFLKVTF